MCIRDRTHTLQNKLSRYMPSEILLNPQATDLSGLEDFLRDKLSAAVECLDFEVYTEARAQQAVSHQFKGRSMEELSPVSYTHLEQAFLFCIFHHAVFRRADPNLYSHGDLSQYEKHLSCADPSLFVDALVFDADAQFHQIYPIFHC